MVIETVDTILGARGIDTLDFLKIDTEGFERLVLEGASTALRGGRIRAIQLEYGLNWFRATQALKFFDGLEYDVFYGTPSGLIHLNRWSSIFELPKTRAASCHRIEIEWERPTSFENIRERFVCLILASSSKWIYK